MSPADQEHNLYLALIGVARRWGTMNPDTVNLVIAAEAVRKHNGFEVHPAFNILQEGIVQSKRVNNYYRRDSLLTEHARQFILLNPIGIPVSLMAKHLAKHTGWSTASIAVKRNAARRKSPSEPYAGTRAGLPIDPDTGQAYFQHNDCDPAHVRDLLYEFHARAWGLKRYVAYLYTNRMVTCPITGMGIAAFAGSPIGSDYLYFYLAVRTLARLKTSAAYSSPLIDPKAYPPSANNLRDAVTSVASTLRLDFEAIYAKARNKPVRHLNRRGFTPPMEQQPAILASEISANADRQLLDQLNEMSAAFHTGPSEHSDPD